MNAQLARRVLVDANAAALARLQSCFGEPLFVADWDRVVFMHFEVDPESLETEIPFDLDLREGRLTSA